MELDELLGSLGRPIKVGSFAMGLMVRRDIDITVICPNLDGATLAAFTAVGARLAQKTEVVSAVRFRNDCGIWNSEPDRYPDGLYLGLTVGTLPEAVWNLDIWAVADAARQPDLLHLTSLLPRITNEHRLAILNIKHFLQMRQRGSAHVYSALVYEAVVEEGVRTVEEFLGWHQERAG